MQTNPTKERPRTSWIPREKTWWRKSSILKIIPWPRQKSVEILHKMWWSSIHLVILPSWWHSINQWSSFPKWRTWFILSILEKTKASRNFRNQPTRSIIHWRQISYLWWNSSRSRARRLWTCLHHPRCWQIHPRLLSCQIWKIILMQLGSWTKAKRCSRCISPTTQWLRWWGRLIRLCIWPDPKEAKDRLLQVCW